MLRSIAYLALLTMAMVVPITWGDVPTVPAGPVAAAASNTPASAHLPIGNSLVSLDFQDADIRNVLKVLAFKSGVNIVAAPEVTGTVTIELKDVPWQKALDVILSTYGYGFDRKDNIITVMSVEKLKKYREDQISLQAEEPLVSRTFPLSFAKAEDAMKIIDKLVGKRGFINFDDRTNAIIIRDEQANLDLIAGAIKSIDTVTPQVSIETKIVETDLSNTENMGIDWVLQASISGSSHATTFPFTEGGKGILGQGGAGSYTPADATGIQASSGSSSSSSSSSTTSSNAFTYGTINASQLSATLQILSTRSTTKILSNPRIVTLDNEKATINVGEQYPEATYSFNSSTGQLQVTGFTQLPIGVNFEVTPHVNNAGTVTLDVHPQISAIDTSAGTSGFVTINGTQLPITTNQEAETNVMVQDGQTLVIGGLIRDQEDVIKSQVPILGDIPFIGALFRNSNTTKTKQEVLIFLTPHIMTIGKSAPDSGTNPK